jgi:hypothetical protein
VTHSTISFGTFHQFPGSVRPDRLTDGDRASLIDGGGRMESRSIFVSSLSRRQLARRRPSRHPLRADRLMWIVLVSLAIVAIATARGLI